MFTNEVFRRSCQCLHNTDISSRNVIVSGLLVITLAMAKDVFIQSALQHSWKLCYKQFSAYLQTTADLGEMQISH